MLPDKKTEYADQLQKFLNEFSTRFKNCASHKNFLEILSAPFQTDVDEAPVDIQMELIDLQARTDLKTKYMEMNLGDFYCKHLDEDIL